MSIAAVRYLVTWSSPLGYQVPVPKICNFPDPILAYFPLTLKRLEESDQNPEPDRNILRNIPKSQISIGMKIYLVIEVDSHRCIGTAYQCKPDQVFHVDENPDSDPAFRDTIYQTMKPRYPTVTV
jgi:hypothetical protein